MSLIYRGTVELKTSLKVRILTCNEILPETSFKEVITNEHVVAMMKAAISDTEDMPMFEPKMTRSKLKEVVEKGVPPQFVDIPLEDEDSSDEEYCPDEEEEDETAEETFQESDVESTASSPRGGRRPRTPFESGDEECSYSPTQQQLFNCQALRKLSMPDNDLSSLPTTIASLVNLKELDISKNGIQDFPDNIKCCKCLTIIEASVNPIAKLPDGFTQLLNLMQLYLNDAFLEYLPANFGRLTKLRILELRENHLKTLPKSIHRLAQLERLDLGNNEFTDMPEVLEQIQNLKELWMDNNGLQTLPGSIGKLKQLTYLDMSKNRVETIDSEISGCEALEDLLLSSNMLQQLPDSIGMLKKLTTLKVDDNQLTALPNTIGSLSLLEEFDCSCNELESLPPTIGYLHNLRTLAADENFLSELPREIGSCKNVTVMSLRSNKLEFLPEEIGQMQKLRVLNLSDNRLRNLPLSFTKLKELAALWLSDNQSKALIPLQSEAHPETKLRVLTNYMFPQQPRNEEDYQSDSDSFNPTLWEEQRQQRVTVAFDFEDKKEEEENSGKVKVEINLKRYPTPYPEDLKNMVKSVQNLVGKTSHALTRDKRDSSTNMELQVKDKYEHKWPISTKEVTDREAKDFQKTQMTESSTTHNSAMEIPKRKEKDELTERSEIALHRVVPKQQQPETLSLTASCFCLIVKYLAQGYSSSVPQDPVKGAIVISKSTERLSPMMKEVKAKFKKSQSIDEIDIGSYKVYSIPLDNYGSRTENQGSLDKPETQPSQEQSMSRSQSVPMLDEELEGYASGKGSQQQKPPIPKKVYHFDQSFNPKGAVDMKSERRLPTSFNTNPEYMSQQGKNIPKEVLSPRGYRGYTPMEHMFSFSQPSVNEDSISQQFPSQRSRPGFLRRADSLVSSTEMAVFRRVTEAQELPLNDRYNRTHYKGMLEHQNSLSSMAESQFHKRNGRYEDEYSSYQETKKPITGFHVKNLTQRRPLSARSYSTESYGASQARPVSARPTMAALLEKVPSDYNLSTCTEKTSDNEMKMRTAQMKGDESSSKMPVDWRQQLLRHIEAKRLDRGSSGSSNPPGNVGALQTGSKDGVVPTHWTNRLAQSFPQPIETKPLLSQRESAPAGIPQQRNERHPLTDTFDNWNDGSHYDNTGFVAEETGMENSGAAPMLGSNSRSASTHGRRPLMRQDRIVGVPLELEQTPHTFHNVRNTPETEVPAPNPWQNWTRTPSPFEDRTAFPSKLESTPASSPAPDRKDFEQEMGELPGTFPSTGAWGFMESRESGASRSHSNIFHCRQDPVKGAIVISKSTERLSPMMKEVKAKFKKSQSIDEIDIGSYKVYSIPLDNYGSSTENQGSLDKPETQPSQEQSMSRSQSVPMLDEELEGYASGKGSQQQKPPIPKKVYHFDQSFNPKGAVDMKSERRLPTSFNTNPEYMSQQGKNIPKEVLSPRGYRGYTPMEHMFSFSQPSVNEDSISQQFPSQRSRPGFLRRADSLVSSTEMALFRRVTEVQELPLSDRYNRTYYKGMLEHQNSMSSMAESQFQKRNAHSCHLTLPSNQNAALKHNTVNLGNLYAGRFSAVHANTNMTLNFDNNPKHEYQKNQHTPSQQSNVLDNGQEDVSPTSQWAPYSLGRRDIPPENVIKKLPDSLPNGLNYPQAGSHSHQVQTMMVSSTQNPQHRSARDQQYEGAINKISIQQYQSPLPIPISSTQSLSSPRGAQSGRCLIQTKGQKSMDGYQDQFCVRIEKNPGLGFSITGGISGQGNPFKPSDMGIFVTRVQPDGSACNVLQPGDKILKANGHSFSHLEHEKAVSLLKSFPKTVDLFHESDSVGVSQHLTNTVFVDRALIVVPFAEGVIPDEAKALSLLAPANAVAGLLPGGGLLPTPNPMASIGGVPLSALGGPTLDQGLAAYGLQGASLNSQSLATDQLLKLMSSVDPKLNHMTAGLVNPAMKSDASSKEIEEAMKRVREAQSLISAAIEPGNVQRADPDEGHNPNQEAEGDLKVLGDGDRILEIGVGVQEANPVFCPLFTKCFERKSNICILCRDRRRRRSRSVTRSPPKKSPKRKMSKSPSPRRHKKEKKKDKERERDRDRGREREKDRDRSRDERERSTSKKKKSKDKDKEKERERKSDGEKGDVKVTRDYDEEEQGYDSEKDKKEDKGSDSASPKAKESSVDKGMGDTVRESKVNGDDHHEEDMDMSD
ncbi:UNVERIFIED_CONTAM: hypothetical protein FKN15_076830 [Acipenser sinensis]